MASRGLGTLTLDLVAKTGAFTGPLDKAARDADRSFRRITDSASKFGKALGTGIGLAAVAATTALIGITKAAIDNADAIRDLSIRTGIGTETLSAYGYAASQTGTSIEALGKGLNILAKNAAAALNPTSAQSKIFEALGISVTDATGNLKDMDELLPEIATKFKNLEDGTTKTALVLKLFGRAGAELTEFLNQGGEGLDEFTAKVRELGLVVDQDTADAADKFKDTLGEVKASVGGLGLSIARELLPALQEGADDFKALVKEGNLAHNMVTLLSAAFSFGVGALNVYNAAVERASTMFELAANTGAGFREILANLANAYNDGSIVGGINKIKNAQAEALAQAKTFQAFTNNQFSNVQGGASTVNPNARPTDARALALALSNPRAPKSGGKKGKSDAEKEAEALLKAYQNMEASYREQIALVGDVTEVERLRYELANGEGKKFTESQKATLLALAAEKDAVDAAHEQLEEGKRLTESLLEPFEAINAEREKALELLNAGAISQETYNRALEASLTPAEQMLEDLAFETEMLGKTIEQQELLTAARLLGAEATTAQGQAAIEALKNFQAESKLVAEQVAVMDDIRDGFGDFFTTIVDGSKSASDAFKDLIDDIFASLTRWATNKLVEDFFGAYGSTNSGSSGQGFDWGAMLGSFFGGGKASGGSVSPGKFYRVNENGPEMLSVAGKDYLMMGNNAGIVSANGGAGANQTNNFIFAAPTEQRTQQQVAQRVGYETNRALVRNR